MPAKDDSRTANIAFTKNALRQFFHSIIPETDDCIIWRGPSVGDVPIVGTSAGTNGSRSTLTVRDALCAGRIGTPVMTCDTSFCINPKHMQRQKTARPNDIGQSNTVGPKGRMTFQAKKFDTEAALALLNDGKDQHAVATAMGVSQATISRFVRAQRGIKKPVTEFRSGRAEKIRELSRTMGKAEAARMMSMSLHEVAAIASHHDITFNETEA